LSFLLIFSKSITNYCKKVDKKTIRFEEMSITVMRTLCGGRGIPVINVCID